VRAAGGGAFIGDLERAASEASKRVTVHGGMRAQTTARAKRKDAVSCDGCFFRANGLCALDLAEPCATFRPAAAELRPPQQLRFAFRQERRGRAAWTFPSAQEQAALHA